MKDKSKSFYITLIVILILIFSYRVFTQNREMRASIEKIQREGMDLIEFDPDDRQEETADLQRFTSPSGKLSFSYLSDWSALENEEVLAVMGHPSGDYQGFSQDQAEELREAGVDIEESYEDYLSEQDPQESNPPLEELNQIDSRDFILTKIKSPFLSLEMGFLTLQKITLKEEKEEDELTALIKEDLTYETGEESIGIIEMKDKDGFKLIKTESLLGGRPVFKSNHLLFLGKDQFYILTLGSVYEDWDNFENEFEEIISSVEFNDDF